MDSVADFDLTGLGKPLRKLFDHVAKGIGAVAGPWIVKRQAKALRDAQSTLEPAQLAIQGAQLGADFAVDVQARVEHVEKKRQRNLAGVVDEAMKALPAEVDERPVDEDWIGRFFSYAQDVSSSEMQELWGRLLSGEIAQPGAVSLRTLEFVRTASSADADLFEKALGFCVNNMVMAVKAPPFLPPPPGRKAFHRFDPEKASMTTWLEERDVPLEYMSGLQDLGLVRPGVVGDGLSFKANDRVRGAPPARYLQGRQRVFVVTHETSTLPLMVEGRQLSRVGRELASIVETASDKDLENLLQAGLVGEGLVVSTVSPAEVCE